MRFFCPILIWILYCAAGCLAWGDGKKVKLTDISTLTLHHGKMTTGRRNAPIPQMSCVGGTAGCKAFTPKVVQCYNRGSDGYDVQWECKTDMDNAYRFGSVEVMCEGYDYPDDPYVLKGSCGMEYTLDFSKEGYQQQGARHDYYGGDNHEQNYQQNYSAPKKKSGFGDVILIVIIGIVVYAFYKTCIRSQNGANTGADDGSSGPGQYPHRPSWFGFGGGGGGGGTGGAPPPPGFRSDYTPGDSCSGNRGSSSGSGAGGFWTGAAMGGILTYILGNRGNRGYTPSSTYSENRAFGGTGQNYSSFGGGSSSSGTRTASGFGGTRRR